MGSEDAAAADPEAIPEAIERQGDDAPPAVEAERVPYLGFRLGGEVYGLPLQQLREVCRLTRLRRIPGAPSRVAGLVNLRGEIICALNAHAILGVARPAPEESAPEGSAPAFFVALRGFADPIGLVVDDIADIYAIDPGQIEPPPSTWSAERSAFVVGTAQVREGLMGLLDLQRLVVGA